MHLPWALCTAPSRHELFSWLWQYCKVTSIKTSCLVTCLVYKNTQIQSNLAIRNFLVALKLFLNAKRSLSLWSKWQIGRRKWFLNTNLFLIKPFLIAKFDCNRFTFLLTLQVCSLGDCTRLKLKQPLHIRKSRTLSGNKFHFFQ